MTSKKTAVKDRKSTGKPGFSTTPKNRSRLTNEQRAAFYEAVMAAAENFGGPVSILNLHKQLVANGHADGDNRGYAMVEKAVRKLRDGDDADRVANVGRPKVMDERRGTIDDAIVEILGEESPLTCRHIFYRLVARDMIPKTDAAYKCVVIKRLGKLRRNGTISFEDIVDESRSAHEPQSWNNPAEIIRASANGYCRDIWQSQETRVEVWCEKQALLPVLRGTTDKWLVPFVAVKGHSSITLLYERAQELERWSRQGKSQFIYYFGDHDPSGLDIARATEEGLREFGPDADFEFTRVGVTLEHIEEFTLITRPAKKSDRRSRTWGDRPCVELDAVPLDVIRGWITECIKRHIDEDAYEASLAKEKEQQDRLETLADEFDSDEELEDNE